MRNASYLIGERAEVRRADFGDSDFRDFTIALYCRYARGKTALDLGYADHNPEGYLRDPLPAGLKHTTICIAARVAQPENGNV